MAEEKEGKSPGSSVTTVDTGKNELSTDLEIDKTSLNKESVEIINQVIAEASPEKTKDLTYLFNQNQTKKTMVRVNQMNNLMDLIVDQTVKRVTLRPDELSNQELFTAMKVVQDVVERGQKQIASSVEQPTPLIQVNQQHNEINLGEAGEGMSRESRDRVKNAVLGILAGLGTNVPEEEIDATSGITTENTAESDKETVIEAKLVNSEEDD